MAYIITLSGMLGSGKSTIGKMLADRLGFTFYSTGSVQREIAKEYGVTTLELNEMCKTHPEIDKKIDSVFIELPTQGIDYVVDSRMAFHFIPLSFKVKLNIDVHVAAERVMQDTKRTSEQKYTTPAEAENALRERRKLEVERFKRIYQVDIDNEFNFDYVIDTTHLTPEEVCNRILERFEKFKKRLETERRAEENNQKALLSSVDEG